MNIELDYEWLDKGGRQGFGSDLFDFEPHPVAAGPDVVDRDWSTLLLDEPTGAMRSTH